jgi:hypothetical protein
MSAELRRLSCLPGRTLAVLLAETAATTAFTAASKVAASVLGSATGSALPINQHVRVIRAAGAGNKADYRLRMVNVELEKSDVRRTRH